MGFFAFELIVLDLLLLPLYWLLTTKQQPLNAAASIPQ